MPSPRPDFWNILRESLNDGTFRSVVLANRRDKRSDAPGKQSVRPIGLRGQLMYQWELQIGKQQSHLNLDAEATISRAENELETHYREAYLTTADAQYQARVKNSGISVKRLQSASEKAPQSLSHNREKQRLIPEGTPCPFLMALGVMTPTGQVKQQKQKKFRQINRYLEIINDIYPSLPVDGTLRVVDFGCGLSYLTFAVHHLLANIHHREVRLFGIDHNDHVIQRCQTLASELQIDGMSFESSEIEVVSHDTPIDLAISLHACDTATDAALEFAVRSQAHVILAAPCCQHELTRQLDSNPLKPLLDFGIFRERFSTLLTDTLRATALETCGYHAQILEFIELEHTPKNVLIRAVRQSNPTQRNLGDAIQRYDDLKKQFGLGKIAADRIRSHSPVLSDPFPK